MRRGIIVIAAVALAGCTEHAPTDPGAIFQPQFSSLSHSSEFFSFLSPVPPGSQPNAGAFHAYAAPRLDICRIVTAGDCVAVTHATLTGSGADIEPITVDLANQQYQTNWKNLGSLPRGFYRLTVAASPLGGGPVQHLGAVEVELATSGGSGLVVSGNTLPVKFRILVGAFCDGVECDEFVVDNSTGGQFILDDIGDVGTFGIEFDPGFLCGPNQTNCADGSVVVSIERYRGPERCIPVAYDAIQLESCVTIRVEPFGVKVTGVTIGMCIEPFGDKYADSHHLRILKVREDAAGVVQPNEIVDLNGSVAPFFFECSDEFVPTIQIGRADGALSRLAGMAASALRPLGRLLTPSPLHARRGKGPVIASLEDFSRIGPVIPVRAEFDRDNAIGFPNTPLPAGSAPRARVIATWPPASPDLLYLATSEQGVGGVLVEFTPEGGATETVYTDNSGYAVASWTLGAIADNPHSLLAEVFYPDAFAQNGDFPNFLEPWATHTFFATAQAYDVYFLSPLGTSSGGKSNVTSVTPTARVCGPLAAGASAAPGQSCAASLTTVLPAPTLSRNGDAWSTAWKTDKATVDNSLYRIDILVNGYATGAFLVRRGGGGGSDPAGTYQFQTGSNLPVRFTLEQ